jgi:hypothetical protein
MSSNKSIREQLEKIYGRKCMIHEGIRTLKRPVPRNARYKGKSIANQLTMHHLTPKRKKRIYNNRKWKCML